MESENDWEKLFSPSVCTVGVCANIVKSHFLFSTARLGLEKHCLSVGAFGTRMILSSWKSWIRYNISNNLSQFTVTE